MHEIYFLARHAPFWGIPFMILGLEFCYLFWLRKKKRTAFLYMMMFLIGALSTSFYYWVGGPEKSVSYLKKIHREYKH
jgi:hypothetical protein